MEKKINDDIGLLGILAETTKNHPISQREIIKKTGLNNINLKRRVGYHIRKKQVSYARYKLINENFFDSYVYWITATGKRFLNSIRNERKFEKKIKNLEKKIKNLEKKIKTLES